MQISIQVKNIKEVQKFLKNRPNEIRKELNRAVKQTVFLIEGEAKRRTPVNTGRLRTSISSKTRELEGEVSTNVRYAIAVHENLRARHTVGEAKYMENAFKHSIPTIKNFFEKAIKNVLKK